MKLLFDTPCVFFFGDTAGLIFYTERQNIGVEYHGAMLKIALTDAVLIKCLYERW